MNGPPLQRDRNTELLRKRLALLLGSFVLRLEVILLIFLVVVKCLLLGFLIIFKSLPLSRRWVRCLESLLGVLLIILESFLVGFLLLIEVLFLLFYVLLAILLVCGAARRVGITATARARKHLVWIRRTLIRR